jgi:hypothetical protein
VHARKPFLPPGGSECNRCAVSLSSQCDECTHVSHAFRLAEVNANNASRKGPFEVRNAYPRMSIGNGMFQKSTVGCLFHIRYIHNSIPIIVGMIPRHVRGFFYSGATTGKPSLRVRELFSTHDGYYATRSLFFSYRGILRNASYPVRFISRHISFFAECGHPRKGRGTVACALVASAYICVCALS